MHIDGKIIRRGLAALALPIAITAMSATAHADYRPGRDAYLRGEFSRAFELFLPPALQGDVKSRIGLGLLLARGHGMKQDLVRSYAWHDAALADGADEHIVVRILAQSNRNYLAARMTPDQLAAAKLRSAMMRANPDPTRRSDGPRKTTSATMVKPVKASLRTGPVKSSEDVTIADANLPSREYRIQLAALEKGRRADLMTAWTAFSKRYKTLHGLKPSVVRLDVDGFGAYEALRAGKFERVETALRACSALLADKQDCFVVPD